jgi:hypothetical protein
MNMKDYFKVGETISNFCNGFFGRDDYEKKIAVIVEDDFVVFKYIDTEGYVLLNKSEQLKKTLDERGKENWTYNEEENENQT